mgnify:CR=1 FL=1
MNKEIMKSYYPYDLRVINPPLVQFIELKCLTLKLTF